ncbi:hypothetical protein [Kaistia granuli]|uniref:hypothetical protein n=1 Tax=Kaistia granuli TaxID=363259 RepID=UPI000382A134|nr:hypothetical protein [Kaistia granuli]
MTTDWNQIRAMMNAAIDACERIEASGYGPADRDATIAVNGQEVSVGDILASAWTYPENLRYAILRARHEAGADLDYRPETARILVAMAEVGAELIGAGETRPAECDIHAMIGWFRDHATPSLERAIADRRAASSSSAGSRS